MYCIKNEEGLFFNDVTLNNGEIVEIWSEYQAVLFPNIDEAMSCVERMGDFTNVRILPIYVGA